MCSRKRNTDPNSPRLFECEYVSVTIDTGKDESNEETSSLEIGQIVNLLDSLQNADRSSQIPDLSDEERDAMAPVVSTVSAVLYEYDPMCLNYRDYFDVYGVGMDNHDEYDPEARSLLAMLKYGVTEDGVPDAIAEVFEYYFSSDFSMYTCDSKWITMAQRIWVAWAAYQEGLSTADK